MNSIIRSNNTYKINGEIKLEKVDHANKNIKKCNNPVPTFDVDTRVNNHTRNAVLALARAIAYKRTALEHPKKRLASKELPKSIRLPLDTHSAISTISNIENKKMNGVVTDIVEEYIQHLPPQNKKLIRNNIEAIKNWKSDKDD